MGKVWDALYLGGDILTMRDGGYHRIAAGALGVTNKRIAWVGPMTELSQDPYQCAHEVFNLAGRCLTPMLIDCHTHLVYAGNRAKEFEWIQQGKSYQEIAAMGGGIRSTVMATREASESELLASAYGRVKALIREGVGVIEIKSGYGLDLASERKILRVARELEQQSLPIKIMTTFLGAHVVPPEYQHNADCYIDELCQHILPTLYHENLVDAVDGFCESMAFSPQHIEKLFKTASDLGLPVKLHAEQLSHLGGASLVAKYQGLSADHLEYATESDIQHLAQAGSVAVLLPGAYYFLQQQQKPPVDLLRNYHVPMAIATDANPGSSPIYSLSTIMNMACVLFDLTPEEALAGVTLHAAKALGIDSDWGSLEVGKLANFISWEIEDPAEILYQLGSIPPHEMIYHG